MNMKTNSINSQNGIAMIIALMFLLITTLLGVSTLQANLFGEKMTLSAIQRERALEAAEGALLEGEAFVEDFKQQIFEQVMVKVVDDYVPTNNGLNCTGSVNSRGGLCVPVEHNPTYNATTLDNWIELTDASFGTLNVWSTTARHREASDALTNKYKLVSSPRYIVEFMGFTPPGDDGAGGGGVSNCKSPPSPEPQNPQEDELENWPYCTLDRYLFRITALATAGNYDETRVMLQSTYIVEP